MSDTTPGNQRPVGGEGNATWRGERARGPGRGAPLWITSSARSWDRRSAPLPASPASVRVARGLARLAQRRRRHGRWSDVRLAVLAACVAAALGPAVALVVFVVLSLSEWLSG